MATSGRCRLSGNVPPVSLAAVKNLHFAEPSGVDGITTLLPYSVSGSRNVSRLTMESRTHSDENGQASEAELVGLRGSLAQEVMTGLIYPPPLAISATSRDLCPETRQTMQTITNNGIRELLIPLEA